MIKNYLVLLVPVCLSVGMLSAQFDNESLPDSLQLTVQDTMILKSDMVGLGFNMIMDTGEQLNNFPGSSEDWHAVPYPSRVSYGHIFKSGLGLEAIAAYNRFMEGKVVEGVVLTEDQSYFSLDSRISYNLERIFGDTGWFDPYIGTGLGYTSIDGDGGATVNGVLGFRTWLSDRWGLDFNSTGKWALGDGATNHMQHAAGVVYRFNIEKGLNKQGEEKMALIRAHLAEEQRKAEAIAEAKRAEEERLRAEQLKREQEEAARLAAEEERKQSEATLKESIRKRLEDAGFAYYNFDSSYLTQGAKEVLDEVAAFLTEYQDVTIKLTAHADSRGTEKYNQWLSERRAKRALDYLISKGVDEGRIFAEGKGEEELRNDCEDGVPCPEDKHRENRRSQFIVFSFD